VIASGTNPRFPSCVKRRSALVVFVCLLAGCSSRSDGPTNNDVGLIYPTLPSGAGVEQCRSEVIRTEGETVIYRNTYISINPDGTETVQSESEGTIPCP
jgi:uncharacterized protein YcfL